MFSTGSCKAPRDLARARDRMFGGGLMVPGRLAVAVVMALTLAGCSRSSGFSPSSTGVSASPRVFSGDSQGAMPKGGGVHKLGSPYMVSGRMFVPKDEPGYDRRGLASWYGDDFHGRRTANGEIYDMNALTAAHPTLPLPSYVYVTNLRNQRTVLVRVNDRGPYVGNRIIDLSRATARALSIEGKGIGEVRVRYAGPAPIDGNDVRERRYLAAQQGLGSTAMAYAASPPAPASWQAPEASTSSGWSPHAYRSGLLRR